ncbi:olfactory receptor 8U9-like [Lithobates pipiens]
MNKSSVLEFVFTGLTDKNELNIPLFVIFLHVYITTVLGNVGIIIIVMVDKHLHKPMYLFLSNLSFVDLTYSSAITPKLLKDLLSETKAISFAGCAVQMYVFVSFATIECISLGIMAYDRYVAICSPLLYGVLMSGTLCFWMVVAAYVIGFMTALVHTISLFLLNFCRSNIIDHFFCDLPPLYKLSCSDTSMNLAVLIILGGLVSISCFILILFSYTNIILAILRIRSAQGRYKAFNTCTSHMTAVSVFYGTIFFMYLRPSTSYVLQQDRVASVFYSIIIALLNPFIYSLQNAEVKDAVKSFLKYF